MEKWRKMTGRKKYIGAYNYQKLFGSAEVYETIWRTVQYALIVLPFTLILGFILALMLKRASRLNVLFRTMLFTPRVSSMVAISVVWMFILNPQYGLLNSALGLLGIAPVRWINETSTALPSLAGITIWRMLGYSTVVYLGGIQNISEDVLEAATIDGANAWQKFKNITVPFLIPIVTMLVITTTKGGLTIFDYIQAMTAGGPAQATEAIGVLIYRHAMSEGKFAQSVAESMCLFVIVAIVSFLTIKISSKKEVGDDA